ncbi:hypothetical protein [Paractinoplanes globisporus]|uniref:Uncharacterized protein n=1 Tax=Paractinoplanes globisporus TaxID=113565 RepID=A0ABW6WLR1_9ACTN|nr:hypothetical protein [Actinoplanes globisporus]
MQGHPVLMRLLADAEDGQVNLLLPAVAVAEAQAVLAMPGSMWDHIFAFRGVVVLELTGRNAVEAGTLARPRLQHHPVQPPLTGPLMAGHVLREAIDTNAVIVTRIPELYGGHDVAVSPLPGLDG